MNMIEFDIDDIREEIQDLSYEKKLEFLKDKEDEVGETINELEVLSIEIMELREEILRNETLLALQNAGYDVQPDTIGNLSFDFDEASITIYFLSAPSEIHFSFYAYKDQLTYRKTISSLVPEYNHNDNSFSKDVTEETFIDEIVSLVRRLMNRQVRS